MLTARSDRNHTSVGNEIPPSLERCSTTLDRARLQHHTEMTSWSYMGTPWEGEVSSRKKGQCASLLHRHTGKKSCSYVRTPWARRLDKMSKSQCTFLWNQQTQLTSCPYVETAWEREGDQILKGQCRACVSHAAKLHAPASQGDRHVSRKYWHCGLRAQAPVKTEGSASKTQKHKPKNVC